MPRVLYKVSRGLDVAYIASEAIRHLISTYIIHYDVVGYHGVIGKQLILDRGVLRDIKVYSGKFHLFIYLSIYIDCDVHHSYLL